MRLDSLGFSAATVRKAERAVAAGLAEQDPKAPAVWWVTSERDPSARYRVQSDVDPATGDLSWITCTCPHGMHTGGGRSACYHAAAALLAQEALERQSPSSPEE